MTETRKATKGNQGKVKQNINTKKPFVGDKRFKRGS